MNPIKEPQLLGAVVMDNYGDHWTRADKGTLPWFRTRRGGNAGRCTWGKWDDFHAIEIKQHGVNTSELSFKEEVQVIMTTTREFFGQRVISIEEPAIEVISPEVEVPPFRVAISGVETVIEVPWELALDWDAVRDIVVSHWLEHNREPA